MKFTNIPKISVNLPLAVQTQHLGVQITLQDLLAFSSLLICSRVLDATDLKVDISVAGLVESASLSIDADQSISVLFAHFLQKNPASNDALETQFLVAESECDNAENVKGNYRATLHCDQNEQSYVLTLTYDEYYFDTISAQDFLEKITIILTALVTTPQIKFSEVSLITTVGKTILADPSVEICKNSYDITPTVFLQVAEKYADKAAIRQGQHTYSYQALKNAAEFLAQELLAKGLVSGETVLVSGQSSFGTIAGFIAVMLAGGVLVSLDRTLPLDRQKQIVDLSQAKFIILATDKTQVSTDLTTDLPAHRITIPAWPQPNALNQLVATHIPNITLAEDASAYIFFTSGSTGAPKGVLGSHLGLAHFLDWQRTNFPLGSDDRSAQITALSFDVVLRDIFYPLTSGACVCIPERSWVFDANKILAWMHESRITILHSVPSLMKAWLQSDTQGRPFETLRYIFFAGEPLSHVLLERFKLAAGAQTRIVNLYGPTETTLAKLANEITDIRAGIQPIGKPQPGVDVLILKDRKHLCGLNEIGEIAIRTPYRSKGYYQNQALTDEVFIKNPWRDDDQDLLYCTGDLGKYNAEGKIEIFGRIDAQIKIRGVRMEPNEIEAHIAKFPGVLNAAVTARAFEQQDKTLFAFIVKDDAVHSDDKQLNRELREFLKAKLPEAMVPKRLIVLKELPYLPNGKLNRKAVAQLDVGQDDALSISAELESLDADGKLMIAGLEKTIGFKIHDLKSSFVDLGGDSLSYIQSSIVIEKAIGRVPENWEKMPILELAKLHKAKQFFTHLPPSILIRAISILLIIVGHFRPSLEIQFTSIMLLIVSGWSIGKYQLGSVLAGKGTKSVENATKNIVLPVVLFFIAINLISYPKVINSTLMEPFKWPTVFLFSNLIDNEMDGFHGLYWFIMILVQCYLMIIVILKFKPIVQLIKKNVFQNTMLLAMFFMCCGVLIEMFFDTASERLHYRLPHLYLWLLFIGISFSAAETKKQKAILVGIIAMIFVVMKTVLAGVDGFPYRAFFWDKPLDSAWFVLAGSALLCINTLKVPSLLSKPIQTIAGASLFIYLTHMFCYLVVSDTTTTIGLIKISVICVVESIIAWKLWEAVKGYFYQGFSIVKQKK